MPFPEKTKEEVRYKSRYMCVFCKQLGPLDVHHIIPQREKGSDNIDNAVCLCPTHHRQYGDNPAFYEHLRTERDKWYDYCEKFLPNAKDIEDRFESLEKKVFEIQSYTKNEENVDAMKKIMINTYNTVIANLTEAKKKLEKKDLTPSDIAFVSIAASSATATSGTINAAAVSSIDPEVKSSATYSPYSGFAECPICGSLFNPKEEVCPYCRQAYEK